MDSIRMLQKRIATSQGYLPADFILRSGDIDNALSLTWIHADLVVSDGISCEVRNFAY